MSDRRQSEACPECGAEVCRVRVNGDWKLGDWPPMVPVIDFRSVVVAQGGGYHQMEAGEIKPDYLAYDAWPIGAPPASILIQIHDCGALVRYRGYATEAMRNVR
jgi:hypothetical protein